MQQSALGGVMPAPAKRSFFCNGLGRCSTQILLCLSTAMPPIAPIAHFSGSGCGNDGSYWNFGTSSFGFWTLDCVCPKAAPLVSMHVARARLITVAAGESFRFMKRLMKRFMAHLPVGRA